MKIQRFLSLLALLSINLILHLRPTTAAVSQPRTTHTDFIRSSCGVTLYPALCFNSLAGYANTVQRDPAQLARVAICVSLSKARRMTRYLSNITRDAEFGWEPRATAALQDCFSVYGDAVDQIKRSLGQMRRLGGSSGESLRFQLSNVQTWMSAALTNEDTCTDGFEDVADGPLKKDVCAWSVKVKKITSNALALVNSYAEKASTH